jgi:hypothetical protein
LAIVSLIALLAALALAALIVLHPWTADTVGPRLSVAPGLGSAPDDSAGAARDGQLAIAPARPAPGVGPSFVADEANEDGGPRGVEPSIGPARALTGAPVHEPPPASPDPPPSESSPAPQPTPAAVPVAVPAQPAPAPDAAGPPRGKPGYGSQPGPSAAGGPPVDEGAAGVGEVCEGDERGLSFPFYVQSTAYRTPGADNSIVRFESELGEHTSFALQLWDDGSDSRRGLWSSGEAMDGELFLSPPADGVWHEIALAFQASSTDGFYLLFLDGLLIDARAGIALIAPGSGCTRIDVGLSRDGEPPVGVADVFVGPVLLSDSLESVLP